MRFRTGVTDQYLYFVAVDATDLVTRETGLASFTVVRSRNGAADVTYTTPTVTEIDSTTMPGVYALLLDEDMTIDAGDYTQEVALHITCTGMAPVTRTYELYNDAEGDISDVLSRLTITNSDTAHIESQTTRIHSDTITLASDLAEGDFSDILSRLTVTNSQVLIIKSDTSDIRSALTIIASDTARIESDTNTLASDLAEADFSDIHSRLTLVLSDTSDVVSRLTAVYGAGGLLSDMASKVTRIHSDTITLASDLAEADFSDIMSLLTLVRSDTAVIETVTSDIQSDTNVLITKMRGVVLATGTIGATGNTTTVVHVPDTVLDSLSDDEINNYNIVLYDVSNDEYHFRQIVDWTNTGDLATVSPAFPFTPEASVDLYWILPPTASQFDNDLSDILSGITKVYSDTTTIQSDTTTLASDLAEGDFSDILSRISVITAEGDISDVLSRLTVTNSLVTKVYSDTTTIQSDTTTLASDLAEGDFSDILSRLTVTNSQLLIVKSDTSDIRSALVIIASDTARIESDTNTLASDLAEGDFSDILSRLTVTNSDAARIESKVVQIYSDTTKIDTEVLDIQSETEVIQSQVLIVKSDTSDIRSALVIIASDTAAIEGAGGGLTVAQASMLSQIHSDTQPVGTLFEIVSDIYSDTTAIEGAGGALTAAQDSKLTKVTSDAAQLTFTQAGVVDANIQYVNDTQVTGTGANGDEWGPV